MMTPDEKLAAMEELLKLQKEAKGEPSFMSKVGEYVPDAVKNVGTAAYKGAALIPAGLVDAYAWMGDKARGSALSQMEGHPLSERQLKQKEYIEKGREAYKNSPSLSAQLDATGYQPKTTGEKYVSEGVKGVAGALTTPMGVIGPVRAGITGLMGGLGGEVGGQVFKDKPLEPVARVVGALIGGSVPAIGLSRATNLKELANLAGGKWTPDQWTATKNNMLNARNQVAPVDLNISQSANFPSNMDNVVEALTRHKQGAALIDQLRQQPGQVQNLAQRLEASLKGVVKEPAQIANESQEAASAALQSAKTARSDAVRPLYEKAGNVPVEFLQRMKTEIGNRAKAAPDSMRGDVLAELEDTFTKALARAKGESTGLLDVKGNPIMGAAKPISAQELNESMRSLMATKKIPNASSKPADAYAIGDLSNAMTSVRAELGNINPSFKQGNELYKQISEKVVSPLKKSEIGRISGRTGAIDDVEAVNKLLPLIAKGRNPNSAGSEILHFAEKTADTPEVLQNAFKTHFSNALAKVETTVAGVPSEDIAEQIKKQLFATPAQQQGIKDSILGMAKQLGKEPGQAYSGFLNGLKLIEAAAKRPQGLGVSANDVKEVAGKSILGSGVQLLSLNAGNQAGKGVKALITGNTYRKFAELATTPEGLDKLQELAKVPVMSVKAQSLLNEALAGARQLPTGIQDSNTTGIQGEQR